MTQAHNKKFLKVLILLISKQAFLKLVFQTDPAVIVSVRVGYVQCQLRSQESESGLGLGSVQCVIIIEIAVNRKKNPILQNKR